MASLDTNVVACPECDLLQRIPSLPPGGTARCPRCGRKLAANRPGSLDRTLALTITALIFLIAANVEPLMGLSAAGQQSSTTILGGSMEMWRNGEKIASVLVALFAVVAPALDIGFMLAVLLAVRRPPAPRWVGTLMRWSETAGAWSMVEVMTLGLLVSLVKIASVARVVLGIGIFAAGGLILLLAAMTVSFDPREVWSRVRWANGEWQQAAPSGGADAAEAGG